MSNSNPQLNPDDSQLLQGINPEIGLARWMVRTGYGIANTADLAAVSGIAQSRLEQLIKGADPNDAEVGTLAGILDVDGKLSETDMVIYYTGKWSMAQILAGEDAE